MFNSISNKKVYEEVIEQIQKNIIDGDLKKGDRLPSERELSELMNISRTSIREALRVLESMGVVESIHGEGNFICSNTEKSLLQPLSMMFKLNNGEYKDIFELRKVLEVENARLAAIRATDMDCRELLSIVKEMEEESKGANRNEILVELDKRFHNKVASMSKNCLIESLFNTASMLFERFIEDARSEIIQNDKADKFLLGQHHEICNKIIKKDEKEALKAMEAHMKYIEENFDK
ncbi:FadR/GntR family transcriptional regulator [Terrisporobacter mayombei]|uniref:HTH-type transcriptional regulator LutR n=1 Tax=Terrisporobacter mayombei TaxID=1541 RepID=A0ABY9Q3L3_9FIRM|nr:FadR/GntR family transcriptional regulator [Terrisporobacter mayombei]MCC3866930.1 FadR family transcriptional regulator [Terrisporobacter mayombei]WMT81177.1 HTH-type transcriptional regulator LutR [Terrisporobacter mayombei]